MSGYRSILLSGLADAGWEQVEVIETSAWWASELWRIRSVKQNWGYELILTFVVDPQAHLQDGSPRRASAVWEVVASEEELENPGFAGLPSMPVRERHIHEYLDAFISELNELRSQPHEKETAEQDAGGKGD